MSPCIDVKDGTCAIACPVDCIYEGERMFYIHPTECIECGICETICPVDAIRYDDEVPSDEEHFLSINASLFKDADGNMIEPGGWSRNDEPLDDPEEVRNHPASIAPSLATS